MEDIPRYNHNVGGLCDNVIDGAPEGSGNICFPLIYPTGSAAGELAEPQMEVGEMRDSHSIMLSPTPGFRASFRNTDRPEIRVVGFRRFVEPGCAI